MVVKTDRFPHTPRCPYKAIAEQIAQEQKPGEYFYGNAEVIELILKTFIYRAEQTITGWPVPDMKMEVTSSNHGRKRVGLD